MMSWLNEHRDAAVEVLRIYFGVFLLIKGLTFLLDQNRVLAYMDLESLPFWPYLIVHYVAVAHLCGGLALAMGLVTRVAALIQVPILFGAILFVKDSNELTMLVLILLIMFAIYGSGKLSIDALLAKRASWGRTTSP